MMVVMPSLAGRDEGEEQPVSTRVSGGVSTSSNRMAYGVDGEGDVVQDRGAQKESHRQKFEPGRAEGRHVLCE